MIDVVDKQGQGLDPNLQHILDEEKAPERGLIYCARCSHVVGRSADATSVNGSHEHSLTNPYGISFHLGCFTQALGCTLSGERTAADTWFPGFQWRYASCTGCGQHLGWYFDNADSYFYGLVLDRIQQE